MIYWIAPSFDGLKMVEELHTHRRQRLLTMFGYPFGNLDNEIGFMRSSLSGMAPGYLLVLDVPLAHAPAEDDAEIERKDPARGRPCWLSEEDGRALWACSSAGDGTQLDQAAAKAVMRRRLQMPFTAVGP